MSEIIIYQSADNLPKIQVKLENETVWLSQQQIAELFQTSRTNVVEHIKHIYKDNELSETATCRNFRQVQTEGNRQVSRELPFYNLDMILSLGYRISSKTATQFRIWATQRLKEYLIKGFTMDDERLKGIGGGNYWKELLDRIRDIRSSEKVMYRQVLDLYATATDYSPKADETILFFKTVQNKLHYATSEKTAAEIVFNRADAEKPNMGLSTFKEDFPTLNEAYIAKNYLSEEELFRLNRLVAAFFDLAELKAMEQTQMKMSNWVEELDKFVGIYGKGVLVGLGTVSHEKAVEKATNEYRKYEVNNLNSIEKAYLESLKQLSKQVKSEN